MTEIPHSEYYVGMKFHLSKGFLSVHPKLQFITPEEPGKALMYFLNDQAVLTVQSFYGDLGSIIFCSMQTISTGYLGFSFVDLVDTVAYLEEQDKQKRPRRTPTRFELDE